MNEKINYLEYPARDLAATRSFFINVFGWSFTDYGPDYMSFDHQGVEGGFYRSDMASRVDQGAALTVFLSHDLEQTQRRVTSAGGVISTQTFEFPGGKRFHFLEPSGNEFAVWQPND